MQDSLRVGDVKIKDQKLRHCLLILAAAFVLAYGAALSFAPIVRTHQVVTEPLCQHWFGVLAWLIGFFLLAQQVNRFLPSANSFILPIIALLSGWGLLTIFRLNPQMGIKQTIWLATGILIVIAGLRIKDLFGLLRRYKYIWLSLGILLTALTLFLGVNPYGEGPKLWLSLFNFYFQPAELLKLLLIIYLAAYFSDYNPAEQKFLIGILPTVFMAALASLILVVQRDLGTASIFVTIYAVMLFMMTQKRRLLWIIPLVFILAAGTAYAAIDIVQIRIDTWLNPWLNTDGSSYQIIQSLITLASGGLTGAGPGLGNPGVVPVAISDFILAAIGEEFGLVGTTIIILLFLIFVLQANMISLMQKSAFERHLALGISVYFIVQSFLIISGNLALLPLTGVTLPFLSYGGSSLLTNFICLLLLLKISASEPPFEIKPNRRIAYIGLGAVYIFAAVLLIVFNSFIVLFNGDELVLRQENPRWSIVDYYVPRGNMLDMEGVELVRTTGLSGGYSRETTHIPLSNTLGYTNALYGQSGLEASLYPYLRGLTGSSYETAWWHKQLFNQPAPGLNVKLTIDLQLQKIVDVLMEGKKGAIILMNADTGEVYAISSHPYFDTNTLTENWSELISDPNAPLLNRTTQGVYPLGTISTPILLSALIERYGIPPNKSSIPTNYDPFCEPIFDGTNLENAVLKYGCEPANKHLTTLIQPNDLLAMLDDLSFFSGFDFQLPLAEYPVMPAKIKDLKSFFYLSENFYASPVQMARFAAALTSQENFPIPTLVNSYRNESGDWITFPIKTNLAPVFSPSTSAQITSYLQADTKPYWFSLGHATDIEGKIITWYIGGTLPEWQGSPMVVSVVIEENDPDLAKKIGELLLLGSEY